MKIIPVALSALALLSCRRASDSPLIERDSSETAGASRPHTADPLAPDAPAWELAEKVELTRSTRECDARRSGDYVRIACKGGEANLVEQLAGDPVGVKLAMTTDKQAPYTRHHYVVMPLRRGEKRVVQLARVAANRWEWGASPAAVVSAYWLEDEANPTIVIE